MKNIVFAVMLATVCMGFQKAHKKKTPTKQVGSLTFTEDTGLASKYFITSGDTIFASAPLEADDDMWSSNEFAFVYSDNERYCYISWKSIRGKKMPLCLKGHEAVIKLYPMQKKETP